MFTPQTVVIEPPRLDPEAKGYGLTLLMSIAGRTLILWGVIAILIPQFGITYWMTYLILVGVAILRGPGKYTLIHAANRTARDARTKRLATFTTKASDETQLRARSAV